MAPHRIRSWALLAAGLLSAALIVLWQMSFFPRAPRLAELPAPAAATTEQVARFCGACHANPPPDVFPRAAWRFRIKQMYDLYRDSAIRLDMPPFESVVAWYDAAAPEALPAAALPPEPAQHAWVRWERAGSAPPGRAAVPGVANVLVTSQLSPGRIEIVVCEAHQGEVLACAPPRSEGGASWRVLARLLAPCHADVTDLDRDGIADLLVADLGSFFPSNDLDGRVIWLRGARDGSFRARPLLDGVGRVADVGAADYDGDARLDLAVAVFGWRIPGEVLLLLNRTTDWEHPLFERRVLDARPGSIHVCPGDLNRDGRTDLVALVSQHHESVMAYVNRGGGAFDTQVVWSAAHPAFSSSGIELADLDGDGDLDVLLSNGDVLDPPYLLKPFHGVTWLENTGTFPFEARFLGPMYGAMRAVPADFDGDGDLDVAAVSFLPPADFPKRAEAGLDAIVLFEQTARGRFVRRSLAKGTCDHFTCAAADWNGDGRPDLVTGNFAFSGDTPIGDWIEWWTNLGPTSSVRASASRAGR